MARILVVGDVVDDVIVRPLAAVTPASDTPARIRRREGGSAANVAAWLGWLGVDVMFVGRAGADGAARHTESLGRFGVEARIAADAAAPTATIVITLDTQGERTMYVDRGANARLSTKDVPLSAWRDVRWLHLTGYSFFDPTTRPVVQELVERAHDRGAGVSVDPASLAFLRDCGVDRFLEWTRGADVVLPNLDELRFMASEQDPDRAVAELARFYPAVVATLGATGSLQMSPDGFHVRQRAEQAEVRDLTGAGDAFAAGYLSGVVDALDPQAAMRRGAETAAVAVTRTGARPPYPER
ncbi:sugar/nucleoside kinase (ribokinase family) [Mumia flava]|uniref:Sugar/nucleoside kinase (Ribokinase family) n=1 Tax=Mumia flava TaxID=1348852 RepID=A0A0B2BN39_9ACTN|nr:PfkB family carbohydrate kinase [Mumia flava]PJJ57948.1 sugar/nucleoside kinase (ribokinase family) [Mumia flava]